MTPKKLLYPSLSTVILFFCSCSKDVSNSVPLQPPNVFSVTPNSAYDKDTVVISGQNFTGTLSVSFRGISAQYFKVTSPTIIKAVPTSLKAGEASVEVKTQGGTAVYGNFWFLGPRPVSIDGYLSSNDVGKDSLIAYWPFDLRSGAFAEAISGINPEVITNANLNDGGAVREYLSLTDGHLIYAPIPNLNTRDALSNYTVSLWFITPYHKSVLYPLFLLSGLDFPEMGGQVQASTTATGYSQTGFGIDTMVISTQQSQYSATGILTDSWSLDPRIDPSTDFYYSESSWNHLAITYEGTLRKLSVYVDGILKSSKTTTAVPVSETFKLENSVKTLMGTFAFKEDGFINAGMASDHPELIHNMDGGLDEVRVFNAALSEKQIQALTHLGRAGR